MSAIPRWIIAAGVVVLLLLVGWAGWTFYIRPNIERMALLERDRASLDATLRAHEAIDRDRGKRDTVYLRANAVIRLRVDTLLVRVAAAESVVVELIPDSLRSAVIEILALKDSIITGLMLAGVNDSLRIVLRDSTIAELRVSLAEAITQRDGYRKAAKPSLVIRFLRGLPPFLAGVGAGAIAVTVLRP